MVWDKTNNSHNDGFKLTTKSVSAGNNIFENGIEIENGYHYNGSGKEAFGGANEWNHITIRIPLGENEKHLSDKICNEFKLFIDGLVKKHNLDKKR